MYSFGQRVNTRVVDEPFYAHYLHRTGKVHPGRDEILASQPIDAQEVLKDLMSGEYDVLYVKNMAHHIRILPEGFMDRFQQLILIRDPARLITSFAKVIKQPAMEDIGVKDQYHMWQRFRNQDLPYTVMDSGELLKNPTSVMQKLCASLGIGYDGSMLSWPPGPREADGVWAKYWYGTVHRSTDFSARSGSPDPVPPHCTELYEEAMPYYHELFSHAIKAD